MPGSLNTGASKSAMAVETISPHSRADASLRPWATGRPPGQVAPLRHGLDVCRKQVGELDRRFDDLRGAGVGRVLASRSARGPGFGRQLVTRAKYRAVTEERRDPREIAFRRDVELCETRKRQPAVARARSGRRVAILDPDYRGTGGAP